LRKCPFIILKNINRRKSAPFLQYNYIFTYTPGSARTAADSTKINKILSDITLTLKSAAATLIHTAASRAGGRYGKINL
jgi:hypothetical protein